MAAASRKAWEVVSVMVPHEGRVAVGVVVPEEGRIKLGAWLMDAEMGTGAVSGSAIAKEKDGVMSPTVFDLILQGREVVGDLYEVEGCGEAGGDFGVGCGEAFGMGDAGLGVGHGEASGDGRWISGVAYGRGDGDGGGFGGGAASYKGRRDLRCWT